MLKKVEPEHSSFRDSFGQVFYYEKKIFRTVNFDAKKEYEYCRDNAILKKSIENDYLVETNEVDKKIFDNNFLDAQYILESKKIPHISYPYEWSFSQLKSAALHHLKFQKFLFDQGAVLRDASAYNIQFVGSKPIFIDVLSIKKYEEGEYWVAYKQFCENFLNPLLLRSLKGITHNNWFRGSLEGISTIDFNKLLNFKEKLSFKILTHVTLQAKLIQKAIDEPTKSTKRLKNLNKFSKNSYLGIINQFYNWIKNLDIKKNKTIWDNYSKKNTYSSLEIKKKEELVRSFINKYKPLKLLDLGCNNGQFSKISIDSGAKYVIGYDFDHNAIDEAFGQIKRSNFLPLFLDAANPTPNQGWMQRERKGFIERNKSNAVIALAFKHHLAIAKNIPLEQILEWITSLAPIGLIEFVPKSDETIVRMLENRDDIFINYNKDNFEKILMSTSKIINQNIVSDSGRTLYEFENL